MLTYEVVDCPARTVVGVSTRTTNSAPDCSEKIGGLWKRFLGGQKNLVGSRPDAICYGLYTHYARDDNGLMLLSDVRVTAALKDLCVLKSQPENMQNSAFAGM